ncbi:MAG: hypothetical protein ACOYBY_12700 [Dermatophilaceae bacterium]
MSRRGQISACPGDPERHLLKAVRQARDSGMSWAAIGLLVGTSGEAARQRYGGKGA